MTEKAYTSHARLSLLALLSLSAATHNILVYWQLVYRPRRRCSECFLFAYCEYREADRPDRKHSAISEHSPTVAVSLLLRPSSQLTPQLNTPSLRSTCPAVAATLRSVSLQSPSHFITLRNVPSAVNIRFIACCCLLHGAHFCYSCKPIPSSKVVCIPQTCIVRSDVLVSPWR